MNYKFCYIAIVVLTVLLAGCSINGLTSGYNRLSKKEKSEICVYPANKQTDCHFVSLNGAQLRTEIARQEKDALVYIWVPFCHGKNCLPLYQYFSYATKNKLSLYIVADSYDLKKIREQVGPETTIYFMDAMHYQSNFRNTYRKKFVMELLGKHTKDSNLYANHFYFTQGQFSNIAYQLTK